MNLCGLRSVCFWFVFMLLGLKALPWDGSNATLVFCQEIPAAGSDRLPAWAGIFGTVTDQNGHPIPATITWCRTRGTSWNPSPEPTYVQVPVDAPDGQFRIAMDVSDAGQWAFHNRHLFKIQSEGFAPRLEWVPTTRLFCNLPFPIQLKPAETKTVVVTDSTGKPLVGATLSPAMWNDQRIGDDLFPVETTGEAGLASEMNWDWSQVSRVAVFHTETGHQWCDLAKVDGRLILRTRPVGVLKGQLKNLGKHLNLSEPTVITIKVRDGADFSRYLGSERVTVGRDGRFQATALPEGVVSAYWHPDQQFPWYCGYDVQPWSLDLSQPERVYEKEVVPAEELTFTFHDPAGKPWVALPVYGTDSFRLQVTDSQGQLRMWWKTDVSFDFQLFVEDPFDRIYQPAFGYGFPELAAKVEDLNQPIVLGYGDSLSGIVVDEQGQPVVGATIVAQFSEERFRLERKGQSDSSGRFHLSGIPPKSEVKLDVRKGNLMLPGGSIKVFSQGDQPLRLQLMPHQPVTLGGRVIDNRGQPVPNCAVNLYSLELMKEAGEAFQEVFRPLGAVGEQTMTDQQGYFRYSPRLLTRDFFQLEIRHPGFLELKTLITETDPLVDYGPTFDFPNLILKPAPTPARWQFKILAPSGEPVSEAETIVFGALTQRHHAVSDEEGNVGWDGEAGCPQLLGIRRKDGDIHWQVLDQPPEDVLILPEKTDRDVAWNQRDPRKVEQSMLSWYESLSSESASSAAAKYLKLKAMAAGNPLAYFQQLIRGELPEEGFSVFSSVSLYVYDRLGVDTVSDILATQNPVERLQNGDRVLRFCLAKDQATREELLGELVLDYRMAAPAQKYSRLERLFLLMVFTGYDQLAVDLLQEAWQESDALKAILERGEITTDHGPGLMPVVLVGVVDPDAGFELARLVGLERSIASVRSRIFLYRSMLDPDDAFAEARKRGVDLSAGVRELFLDSVALPSDRGSKWALQVASQLPASHSSLALQAFAIKSAASHEQQTTAFDFLLGRKDYLLVPANGPYEDSVRTLLECLPAQLPLERRAVDQWVWESLQMPMGSTETAYGMSVFAARCALLSLCEPELASQLLRPAFDHRAWLGRGSERDFFGTSRAVVSMLAWVNPDDASRILQEVLPELQSQSDFAQVAIVSSFLEEMAKVWSCQHKFLPSAENEGNKSQK